MAHPARAPNLHIEIVVETVHRSRNRFTKRPAAIARWRRIGDDVDGERDDLARPFVRSAEHHRQRNGQAVIDIHLVDDGHVELVEDQALRNMPGKVWMALHIRHLARAPAFVGGRVSFRRTRLRK